MMRCSSKHADISRPWRQIPRRTSCRLSWPDTRYSAVNTTSRRRSQAEADAYACVQQQLR